jgi:hypothetical protein
METKRVSYLIFLGLFSIIMMSSIYNTLFNYSEVINEFAKLGYPDHLALPLAIIQTIGLLVIMTNKGGWLINWAYAGFFMNLSLAVTAHIMTWQGNGAIAVLGLVLLWSTYVLNKQLKHAKDLEKANKNIHAIS